MREAPKRGFLSRTCPFRHSFLEQTYGTSFERCLVDQFGMQCTIAAMDGILLYGMVHGQQGCDLVKERLAVEHGLQQSTVRRMDLNSQIFRSNLSDADISELCFPTGTLLEAGKCY